MLFDHVLGAESAEGQLNKRGGPCHVTTRRLKQACLGIGDCMILGFCGDCMLLALSVASSIGVDPKYDYVHVNKNPTMHYIGIPRHTQSMAAYETEYFWKSQ